ncbi:MAG TPA: penicillin-binding protein 2, partial [Nitrobacter sp.]|nr:penicillin-binding protein 2 [Nitrobacter sp.]
MTGQNIVKRRSRTQSVLWTQRMIRNLLYGRNVDRAAKARVRVGLVIIVFGLIYTVIAARLVMFAALPDDRGGHRTASQDAIATARPDIIDRNGQVLATDVKAPSLFGEPRRIIDRDEAVELLTATLPDLETAEVRQRLGTRKGFVWLKREITPSQQKEIHNLGIPGIGFLRENKRVYPSGREVAHLIGLVNID